MSEGEVKPKPSARPCLSCEEKPAKILTRQRDKRWRSAWRRFDSHDYPIFCSVGCATDWALNFPLNTWNEETQEWEPT